MDELTRKRLARTLAVQRTNTSAPLPPLPKPASPPKQESQKHTDCRLCVHFFITWEKNCPYGCKAYGFKGPQIPSIVVKSSSGENCNFFRQRP